MKHISILFLIMFSIFSKAQIKTFDIPTPNATELGRYGDIPVSYYTGKADIIIPLYSLTVKGVTLPITLNYNASGVLVNSLPGWLGDNWSLTAGGVITRIVQDICDEFEGHEGYDGYLNMEERIAVEHDEYVKNNYFKSHGSLLQLSNFGNTANNQAIKDSISKRTCDFSPDIFYFNFLGKTGRFFLGNDGQWKVFCNENLEVIFDYNDSSNYEYPLFETFPDPHTTYLQPKTIKGFIIRDENGTEYHFGGSKNYIEYSIPFFRQFGNEHSQFWTANSWYINKIVDRNGNTLFQFEYQRGKYIVQLYNTFFKYEYDYRYSPDNIYYGHIIEDNSYCPFDGVLNSPIYLVSITSSDKRRIVVNSSDLDMSMSTIYSSLYAKYGYNNDNLINAFVSRIYRYYQWASYPPFYYLQTDDSEASAYQFNSSSTEKDKNPLITTRLRKLVDIALYCTAGTQTAIGPKYTFEYDTSARMRLTKINIKNSLGVNEGVYQLSYYTGLTADYITTATDHWGYYNANEISTYPTDVQGYNSFIQQRNANMSVCKAGMLSQIIYPTGGKTVFDYESHNYAKYLNSIRNLLINSSGTAGGVRVKAITNYDALGNILSRRTFEYTLPTSTTQSSGQLYAQPVYYWPSWESRNLNPNSWSVINLFKSTSILPLSNKFGPHVGYSYVKEAFQDGTYNVYQYSNLSEAYDTSASLSFSNNTQTPYDVYTERDYKRGCLLSISNYNDRDTLKRKTDYIYRNDNVENNYVWTSSLSFENFMGNPYLVDTVFSHFTGGVYKLFYPKYDLSSVQTVTYFPENNLSESTSYNRADYTKLVSYGNYQHNVDIRALLSETKSRSGESVSILYTYPFAPTNDATTQELFTKQFFMQPVTVEQTLQGQAIAKYTTLYARFGNLILPQKELEYKGCDPDTTITYNAYTNTGAVSNYRERGKATTSLTWGWGDNYLLNKTEGSLQTSYIYTQNLFLSSIILPNGDHNSYIYDRMGRLSEIRDRNGDLVKKYSYNYTNK